MGATDNLVEIRNAQLVRRGHPEREPTFPDPIFRAFFPRGTDLDDIAITVGGRAAHLTPGSFNGKRGMKIFGPCRGQVVQTGKGIGVTVYCPEPESTDDNPQLDLFLAEASQLPLLETGGQS